RLFRFLFNPTATTEIYTLSLHDALPIFDLQESAPAEIVDMLYSRRINLGLLATTSVAEASVDFIQIPLADDPYVLAVPDTVRLEDRKSTRLNSSHVKISYAVFCLKKKRT